MTIRVAAFARLREIVGASEVERVVAEGACAADLWAALAGDYPALADLRPSTRLVVNGVVDDGRRELHDGDELALLPPFGGG